MFAIHKLVIVCSVIMLITVAIWLWLFQHEVRLGEKILPFTKTWTYQIALQAALREDNPNICDKINKRYIMQDFGVSPKQAQENCKYTYAIEKNNIDYCLTLSITPSIGGVSTRDVCLRELAKKLNRQDFCDLMPSRDYILQCKQNVSIKKEVE